MASCREILRAVLRLFVGVHKPRPHCWSATELLGSEEKPGE